MFPEYGVLWANFLINCGTSGWTVLSSGKHLNPADERVIQMSRGCCASIWGKLLAHRQADLFWVSNFVVHKIKWKGHPCLETHPLCHHVSKCKDTASALRSWNQAVDTGTVPDELATLTRKTQAEACCSRVHMEEQSSHLPLQHLDCVKKTTCRRLNCLEALRKAGVKARSLAQPTPEEKKIQKIGLKWFKL